MDFRNPSPPPGYVLPPPSENVKKISGLDPLTFQDLLLESGIFDTTESFDKFEIMTSEDEVEVQTVEIKKEPKSPEIVITLSDELCDKVKIESTSPKCKEEKNISKTKGKRNKKTRERSNSSSSNGSCSSRHSKTKETKQSQKSKGSSEGKSDNEEIKVKTEKKIKIENIKIEKIKTENIKKENRKTENTCPGDVLHGSYYCDICKASMNSYGTYKTHIVGKRHLKNIKLRNTAEVVAKTIAPTKVESKYPLPPPGVYRLKDGGPCKIQHIVDGLKSPVPGLTKITEIQGLEETTYYCQLCDASCTGVTIVPHIEGHKHQLRSVKLFDPEAYENLHYKKMHEIDRRVYDLLKEAERRFGRGEMKVEREYEGKYLPPDIKQKIGYTRVEMPGPSYINPDDFTSNYASITIPDMAKSDFYCKLCDSHMNSEQMWEAHIRGKRHLTNVKKAPGEAPSKAKSVLLPRARAKLMDELDQIDQAIVGLDEMRETQNPDAPGEMYNCFLCGSCMTVDVIDHILSLKHRTKFLEKIRHPDMLLLKGINMQENKLTSLVADICQRVQAEFGRGYLEVHVMRNAVSTW